MTSSTNLGIVAGILVVLAVAVEPQGFVDILAHQQSELLSHVKGNEVILNSIKDGCLMNEQLALLNSRLEAGCGCLGRGSASQIPYGNLPANFGMPSPEMLHDMAPGKNTFGSSVAEEERPQKAIDGNDNSYFHSTHEKRPWWVIDLGSERVIYHIMILTRQDCCSERLHDLQIRLGNNLEMNGDFSSSDLLYFYRGPYRKEDGFLMYTFAQGVKGRYLSLQIVAEEAEFLQLSTVKVIGLRN
ncbi:uncharacterized protein LOC135225213 [Macrobrachium nipponense]|uniref:uncharacterized protein LOC135225213 n=1 Tax=Macrobrachium nipponense TaxID=159736 RepID=UPI0030C8A7FA